MGTISIPQAQQIAEFLQEQKDEPGDISLRKVISLSELMTESYEQFFQQQDSVVYEELKVIASAISEMKKDIGSLATKEISEKRIPEAGRELEEIITATEDATQTIIEAAEAVMASDPSNSEAFELLTQEKATDILLACSFQDLTGQRISKVVKTLQFIDERISAFSARFNLAAEELDREETDEEQRRRDLILHGPQFEGDGVNQNDIDALLSNSETDDTDQDEIDKLFQ